MKVRAISLVLAGMTMVVASGSARTQPSLQIREIGHLYVGGEEVALRKAPPRNRFRAGDLPAQQIDPNGDFIAGATYVGFVKLANPRHRFPILMIPGGGLSGAVFETTPDGRPGWEWVFLRAGYSVYVADHDQTGRSSFARYPEIDPDEPAFRSKQFLWEVFRIGRPGSYATAGGPLAYPGTQFPVVAFDAFVKQAQPRFRLSKEQEANAFDAMIQAVCPCILLTHSAAGEAGMAAAGRWPQLIKALISIEPSGAPSAELPTALPPQLVVWGDFLDPSETDPDWINEFKASEGYRTRARLHGLRADLLSLPAHGIRGNSHLLMLDRNSDVVAGLIAHWLQARGL
jgi:pimeloyl-ACP methyl ester carboxylesterase